MIARERIEKLLHAGVQAPSGDNSQPWSFRVADDDVIIYAHPERDHALLNVEDRGTLLATGALIENICIAARQDGLEGAVTYFSDGGSTARIHLTEGASGGHSLFDAILRRHTHRGPYHQMIDAGLERTVATIREGDASVTTIADKKDMTAIANAVSVMEETALRTKHLHRLFFDSLIWRAEDSAAGKPGLYIKTTELPIPVRALFRLIRWWPLMRLSHIIGLPRLAAKSNADVYRQSSFFAAVCIVSDNRASYLDAGRCMQRAWLEVTRYGFGAQPMAGLLYLAAYIRRIDDPHIDPSLKERILDADAFIAKGVNVDIGRVAMLLRIGKPTRSASARSARRRPHIL